MNNMSFLLLAQAAPKQPASWQQIIANFFPFILLFVVLYMLWIRPEQKRAKNHREMIKRVKAGDKIVTSGGIHANVKEVHESTLVVEVADKTKMEIERAAIGRVVVAEK